MNIPQKKLATPGLALLLCCSLLSTMVVAQEVSGTAHAPLKSMNQAEYESYHELLDRQVRNVSQESREQNSNAAEKSVVPQTGIAAGRDADKSEGGYGKGYAARREMGGASAAGRAGGYRGGSGSMNRGGGRYR